MVQEEGEGGMGLVLVGRVWGLNLGLGRVLRLPTPPPPPLELESGERRLLLSTTISRSYENGYSSFEPNPFHPRTSHHLRRFPENGRV